MMTGYTPLHFGAMWGRLSCLKLLINLGSADQKLKTQYGETVRDLSRRYNQTDCTVYLECAGERSIRFARPVKFVRGIEILGRKVVT